MHPDIAAFLQSVGMITQVVFTRDREESNQGMSARRRLQNIE